MTVPRIQGSAAVYKDSIYYISGACGNHQRVFTAEVYDVELNKWTHRKDFPCDPSINPYLKLVLFQNKFHSFVRATQGTVEEHIFRTSRKNSLYQYDIDDQWMKVYETPARQGVLAAILSVWWLNCILSVFRKFFNKGVSS